jgi:hypothetical protein
MGIDEESPGTVSVRVPSLIVAITALVLVVMPSELRIALTVWTLASFPIGVLFGHCVLSEE